VYMNRPSSHDIQHLLLLPLFPLPLLEVFHSPASLASIPITIRDCLLGHLSIYRHGPIHIVRLIRVYRVLIEGIHTVNELRCFFANLQEHFMACRVLSREDAKNGKNGLTGHPAKSFIGTRTIHSSASQTIHWIEISY
jgi:hypothetical protein